MEKIKIQIKNRWTGNVLFKYKAKDNTLLNTVLEAIKSNADLRRADLSGADLSNADLSGADLSGANLSGADLSNADLSDADLRRANLSVADLSDANLSGADLSDADLRRANLSGADLDFTSATYCCGFGFAKTDEKIRKQMIAHTASFFVNSELNEKEKELLNMMTEYCKRWHREDEFGEIKPA